MAAPNCLLLSWRHSGFSVHTSVTAPPDDRDGLERLTRYLLRPPVSLERLQVGEHALAIAYAARCKPGLQASTAAAPPSAEHEPASLEWKAARRRWAQLIRRI